MPLFMSLFVPLFELGVGYGDGVLQLDEREVVNALLVLLLYPRFCFFLTKAEAELSGRGRVLIRYSGTQMLCRVMVEGPTNEVELWVANSLQNLLLQEPKPSGVLGRVRLVPRKDLRFEL